jgi:hypothetical protein
VLTAAVAVGYAWVGSGLESHSSAAAVAVAGPAVAVAVIVLRRPAVVSRTDDARVGRTVLLWAALITAGLLWEAYAFFHQPAWTVGSYDHPTLSVLLDPVLDNRAVRFLGWLVWLRAGRRLLLAAAR